VCQIGTCIAGAKKAIRVFPFFAALFALFVSTRFQADRYQRHSAFGLSPAEAWPPPCSLPNRGTATSRARGMVAGDVLVQRFRPVPSRGTNPLVMLYRTGCRPPVPPRRVDSTDRTGHRRGHGLAGRFCVSSRELTIERAAALRVVPGMESDLRSIAARIPLLPPGCQADQLIRLELFEGQEVTECVCREGRGAAAAVPPKTRPLRNKRSERRTRCPARSTPTLQVQASRRIVQILDEIACSFASRRSLRSRQATPTGEG